MNKLPRKFKNQLHEEIEKKKYLKEKKLCGKILTRFGQVLEKTDAGRDWGQEEKGTTEDEMAGWHH